MKSSAVLTLADQQFESHFSRYAIINTNVNHLNPIFTLMSAKQPQRPLADSTPPLTAIGAQIIANYCNFSHFLTIGN